jgi:hypothetical protein
MATAEDEQLIELENADSQPDTGNRTERSIKVSAVGRFLVETQRPEHGRVMLKATYASRLFEHAHPMQMLQEVVVAQLQPPLLSALPEYTIVWSYGQQPKPLAINARQVMTTETSVQQLVKRLALAECSCQCFDPMFMVAIADECIQQHCPAAHGSMHVRTTDLLVVPDGPLRRLLSQGLNHIPLARAGLADVVETNRGVALQFFERVLQPTAAAQGIALQADAWEIVSNSAEAWTMHQLEFAPPQFEECDAEVLHQLRSLQERLHICEVDKTANTPCFICPQYAQLLVMLRLLGSADFMRDAAATPESIAAGLRDELGTIHPKLPAMVVGDRLPIMRIAYKAHKASYRYLTNASSSLLSGMNSLAQDLTACVMQGVIDALGGINAGIRAFVGSPTQTCIVVQNSQQVALNLPAAIHTDMCADITKCFENIPTRPDEADSLPAALRWAVGLAFSHMAKTRGKEQVLAVELTDGVPNRVRWQHAPAHGLRTHPSGARLYLHKAAVADLLCTVVNRAYVTAAGLVFKQTRGIPMGADYSPDACNLYFMRYEYSAVMRMSRLAPTAALRERLCREWLYCFRMMDDMRFINAPTLAGFVKNPSDVGDSTALGWIYPACVGIDVTYDVVAGNTEQSSTQYLDMLTHVAADGSYRVEMYDKQQKLPIVPINYITLASNRPVGNCYKLVIGQACRIAAVCSTPALAAKHISKVLRRLAGRGFSEAKLLGTLRAWAADNDLLPGKPFTMTAVANALACRKTSWLR